jgi:hypothetical protein
MIERVRYIWQLLVLSSVLAILGLLFIPRVAPGFSADAYLVSLASVTVINLVAYLAMYAGIVKSDKEGIVFLLGGVGAKFLLYLLFVLLYWIVTKNLSKAFILTFFALYLIFTFFTVGKLLKLLKNK